MEHKNNSLGGLLTDACKDSLQEVVLVAPFIKLDALKKLLNSIKSTRSLTVITRWLPTDIASGVCDLEIFDLLKNITGAELRMHDSLHAKYYRFDKQIFIGSANLTSKGLGWGSAANAEILILSPNSAHDELLSFEKNIRRKSHLVDESVVRNLSDLSEQIKKKSGIKLQPEESERAWLPSCIRPESIFNIMEKRQASVAKQTREAAIADIINLKIPLCKDEAMFKQTVSSLISSEKILSDVKGLIKESNEGLTDSEAIEFLKKHYENYILTSSTENQWKVLKEWIKYFMGDKFIFRASEEVIEEGQVLKES